MSLNIYPECNYFCNRNRRSTIKDKVGGRSSYFVINQNRNLLDCYYIDGCLNTVNSKCDFLLINVDTENAYLIELKGSDIIKAIRQIDKTVDLVLNKIIDFNIHARIILTKVYAPSLYTSEYIRLKKKIRDLGGTLIQASNNRLEESI